MDDMSLDDESDAEPTSMDMLEYFSDRNQYHISINRIEALLVLILIHPKLVMLVKSHQLQS